MFIFQRFMVYTPTTISQINSTNSNNKGPNPASRCLTSRLIPSPPTMQNFVTFPLRSLPNPKPNCKPWMSEQNLHMQFLCACVQCNIGPLSGLDLLQGLDPKNPTTNSQPLLSSSMAPTIGSTSPSMYNGTSPKLPHMILGWIWICGLIDFVFEYGFNVV